MMKKIAFVMALSVTVTLSHAQDNQSDFKDEVRANLVFGLNQIALGGFNVEGNLFYKRLVFDYSHGFNLQFDNSILDDKNADLGIDAEVVWTTGFGVGYRVNRWLNIRAEPKWHRFDIYDEGARKVSGNRLATYRTFTMGLGAYANLLPFKNKENFLGNIMVAPSVRWWPQVSSTLDNDEVDFLSAKRGEQVIHEAMEVGFNNSPLIVNVSIGYTLEFGK